MSTRKSEHTPGPWDRHDSRWPGCIVSPAGTGGPLPLVRVARVAYATDADLDLMAAAPDLLAALRHLVGVEEMRRKFPGVRADIEPDTGIPLDFRVSIENARAAISKAEGGA